LLLGLLLIGPQNFAIFAKFAKVPKLVFIKSGQRAESGRWRTAGRRPGAQAARGAGGGHGQGRAIRAILATLLYHGMRRELQAGNLSFWSF
jgi:hypothetical protein